MFKTFLAQGGKVAHNPRKGKRKPYLLTLLGSVQAREVRQAWQHNVHLRFWEGTVRVGPLPDSEAQHNTTIPLLFSTRAFFGVAALSGVPVGVWDLLLLTCFFGVTLGSGEQLLFTVRFCTLPFFPSLFLGGILQGSGQL